MTETYTVVGSEAEWMTAFFLMPAAIILVVFRLVRKTKPLTPWWLIAMILLCPIFTALGAPQGVVFAASGLFGAIALSRFVRRQVPDRRLGLAMGALVGLVVILAGHLLASGGQMGSKVVITSAEISQTDEFGARAVPRKRLGATRHIFDSPTAVRRYALWTFNESTSRPTGMPIMIGGHLYYGPRGFVRGDELGRHIADWAGIQPTMYPTYHSPGFWRILTWEFAAR